MDYNTIGEKIRHLRIQRNWTQEMLAEESGVSVSYLGQIERGQRKASIQTLESIVSKLDVTFPMLLSDLEEEDYIRHIWKQKSNGLTKGEREQAVAILEMILDFLKEQKTCDS